jgi:hypothetical protein
MSKPTPIERLDGMVNQLSAQVRELAVEEPCHHVTAAVIAFTQAMYGLEGIMEVLKQLDERAEERNKV